MRPSSISGPPQRRPRRAEWPADQREAGAEHTDQRVRVAARSDRARSSPPRRSTPNAVPTTRGLAVLVAQVPPDEKRHRQEQHARAARGSRGDRRTAPSAAARACRSSGRYRWTWDSRRGTTSSSRRRRRAAGARRHSTACWKSGVQSSLKGIWPQTAGDIRQPQAARSSAAPAARKTVSQRAPSDTGWPMRRRCHNAPAVAAASAAMYTAGASLAARLAGSPSAPCSGN